MGSEDSDDTDVDKHERVLAPDDLDITKRPEVEEIDDGRFVVSSSGPAKKPDKELLENPDWLDSDEPDEPDQQPPTRSRRASTDSKPAQPTGDQPAGQPANRDPAARQPASADHGAQESHQPPTSQSQPSQTQPNQHQQSPQPTASESTPSTTQTASQSESTPSTGNRSDQPTSPELAAHDQPPAEPPAVELTNENVSKFLAKSLAKTSGDYGFDATVNIEGSVNRGRMTSDDIGETLETLLRWYARQTTDEVEPEHVLGIILAGSDLAVEYPVQSAYEVVKQHGLGPDDTISDLLAAVREEGSFTVPPSSE